MQVHDVLSGLDCMKRERPTGTQRLCFAHVSFFLGGEGVILCACLAMMSVLCNYGVTNLKLRHPVVLDTIRW